MQLFCACAHLDGSEAGQTSFLFANPFSIVVLLLLLLQVTVLFCSLLPLLEGKGRDSVNAAAIEREKDKNQFRPWRMRGSLRTDGHLSFTGKDVFESSLVSVLSLRMVSVPALDSEGCLVHLLNEPWKTQRNMSHKTTDRRTSTEHEDSHL